MDNKIKCNCDFCGSEQFVNSKTYKRNLNKNNGKYKCRKCSAKDANIFYGRDKDSSKFTDCCKGKAKTSGVKDGKKLKWMYYDEYSKLVNNEYIGNFVI